MRRRNFIAAFVLSLVLHGAIFIGLRLAPRVADRAPRRPPVQVRLLTPDPPAPETAPAPAPAAKAVPATEPQPSPPSPTSEPAPTSPSPPSVEAPPPRDRRPSSLVRRPKLFAPGAIAKGAERAPDSEAPANPVQDMLSGRRFGRNHSPRQTAAVKELGVRLDSWFSPPVDTVRVSGRTDRKSFAKRLIRYLSAPPRDDIAVDSERLDPDGVSDLRSDRGGWLCLSGCPGSNLQAKLVVIVEIDHTTEPISARVIVSSGFRDYDRAAVRAVEEYARSPSAEVPIDADATHWTFESEVYRYSRGDLLLDPQFEPLGRRIEETFAYVYSMATRIRMVGLAAKSATAP